MPLTINILRPDDLVVLSIELHNLHLSTANPKKPELVVERQGHPAFLVVNFQPQSIAEEAYFEIDPNNPKSPSFDTNAYNKTPPVLPPANKLEPAGSASARMSDSSRLVFRLPTAVTQIPYQMDALLDWSKLHLVVSPIAAVPNDGSAHPGLAIAAPKPLETALELPYRLIMSPPGDVGWVNATAPVTHAGRTELWHTRIARRIPSPHNPEKKILAEPTVRNPVTLRAIWSPDFVDHGQMPSHSTDNLPFLSSMSARDRDQIVILTSGFDGYYAVDPTTGAVIPFLPTPVNATELFLSALGGWWDWRGDWNPLPYYYQTLNVGTTSVFHGPKILKRAQVVEGTPNVTVAPSIATAPATTAPLTAPGKVPLVTKLPIIGRPPVIVPPVTQGPTQQLDLTEWIHRATGARDNYVRIVYAGYLYPFGHRASLVKVSERKVIGSDEAPGGSPVAYLTQRMYVVVREPEKFYAGAPYTYHGREMPFWNHVRINTRVTPSIDQPGWLLGTTASFWIEVGPSHDPFPFHISADDLAGAQCNFLANLIFVSDSETAAGLKNVPSAYKVNNAVRMCPVHGANISYADPRAGDTTLKTTALYFDSQIVTPAPPFPNAPFIPILDMNTAAVVTVPAIGELLGSAKPIEINLYPGYLSNGIDPNAGVFADLVNPLPVKIPANKAGGFGTPDILLTALSARKGLVGGSPDDAAAGLMDPSAFFDEKGAHLFGTIPVKDLIPVNSTTKKANATPNTPIIRSHAIPDVKHATSVITRILWEPELQNYSRGPVRIAFNSGGRTSALTLRAKIERTLDGSPPTSVIHGSLTAFRLKLMGVVVIRFRSFRYTSVNGSKSVVKVHLTAKNALEFKGPLSFVQTLASVLPPGVFGAGPAIDLEPNYLSVSYSLGLPALSIGVFSLQGIRLMVGLDLPYLNGKPAFEFGFATRNSPFLLTVECLGGGGFVHLIIASDGVKMVEGALEFGGEFSIDLGVASGAVHAMAGIYFQLKSHYTDLTGFVDIGGEVSVLGIISISIDLNLSLSYIASGSGSKVQGRATLTISVHVLFFGILVSVSVERSFGSGPGDPKVDQVLTAHDWALYASAFV
jgi:hypothetical protein